jgi:serine/threonine protein kinase
MPVSHFTFHDVEEATGMFDDQSVVGTGNFGCVYAGALPKFGLDAIAVKAFRSLSEVGLVQDDGSSGSGGDGDGSSGGSDTADRSAEEAFGSELHALMGVGQHPCIVRFIGVALDGPVKCIITSRMEGGSLHDRLSLNGMRPPLFWHERLVGVRDTCKASGSDAFCSIWCAVC